MRRLTQMFAQKLGLVVIIVVLLFSIVALNAQTQSTSHDQLERNRKALYKVVTHHVKNHDDARWLMSTTEMKLSTGLERKINELKNQGYEVNQLSSCVLGKGILYTVIMKKPI